MSEDPLKITKLINDLADLQTKLQDYQKEINELRKELYDLKASTIQSEIKEELKPPPVILKAETKESEFKVKEKVEEKPPFVQPNFVQKPPAPKTAKTKSDIEKFIGENLINKIGIIITIIGVGIGAKYAIDHQLISPLARIIIGYVIGLTLAGFGFRLKKKYKNFSAVLVSGAIAITYFITYFARSLYGLMSVEVAFGMMVLLTVVAVWISIYYNRQVIAHIGLVGAYAVPFLLGDNSGNVTVLFTYTAIINAGILVISFIKYWKSLFYSSFVITWLMFFGWYITSYYSGSHFNVALLFVSIYFSIFYMSTLAFKLFKKDKLGADDGIMIVLNAGLFFGLGYNMIWGYWHADQIANKYIFDRNWLGAFTFANVIIHFITSGIVAKLKNKNIYLFYILRIIAVIFLTIFIPVQFKNSWILLLWACEATILFLIGRVKKLPLYEALAYPVILTTLVGLIIRWLMVYKFYFSESRPDLIVPVFNFNFMNSILCIICFSIILFIHKNKKTISNFVQNKSISDLLSFCIPAILIATIYFTIRSEMAIYFEQLYHFSAKRIAVNGLTEYYTDKNYDYKRFKMIWIINYSLIFSIIIAFINMYKIKNRTMAFIGMGMGLMVVFMFLTQGLYQLTGLRDSYMNGANSVYFHRTSFNIAIRYISILFVGLFLLTMYDYIRKDFIKLNLKIAFEYCVHITCFWLLSNEIIYLMDGFTTLAAYKLGLSVLWGFYCLLLIILGISQRKLYLRITAIVVFAATLMKLFIYDIADLETISKTIIFISLGILLLLISFLYIKYRHHITGDINKNEDES